MFLAPDDGLGRIDGIAHLYGDLETCRMPNVFISHSSIDKPLVRRLAASLLAEGIPVWLDSWELEIGDSLLDRIYLGIDTSGALLLAMSENSTASGWVDRELNAGLMKEQRLGRKFVIPVRLDNCNIPLKVADRLYADFSSGFSRPLTVLVQALEKAGIRELQVQPDRELLPISFTREVHLDTSTYTKALGYIRRRQPELQLSPKQVVVNDDAEYVELLSRLHQRIDRIGTDPQYTPRLEESLRDNAAEVEKLSHTLRAGVALLANSDIGTDATYWFCHIVRSQTVYRLYTLQSRRDHDVLLYGEHAQPASISNSHDAMEYYDNENLDLCVIWSSEEEVGGDAYRFWAPVSETTRLRDSSGRDRGPIPALDGLTRFAFSRYVYPQVIYRSVHYKSEMSIPLSLERAWVAFP